MMNSNFISLRADFKHIMYIDMWTFLPKIEQVVYIVYSFQGQEYCTHRKKYQFMHALAVILSYTLYFIAIKCCNLIGQIKVFKSLIPPVIALIPPLIHLYHL